jgi:hypothetical protein
MSATDTTQNSDPELERYQSELKPFLDRNPGTSIVRRRRFVAALDLWGDGSVLIDVEAEHVVDDLNALYFPPPFTAIWHVAEKDLEFIWGPVPPDSEFLSRSFQFRFSGHAFACEFAPASERLKRLALASFPRGPATGTNYRNLSAFDRSAAAEPSDKTRDEPGTQLVSFWIRQAEWDTASILELTRHLNFYMRYFDPHSPMILIHEVEPTASLPVQHRPHGDFPQVIAATELDPYVLGLWESAVASRDIFRAYVHNYQILEYTAFYCLERDLATRVKRILREPDALDALDRVVREVLDTLAEDKRRDEAKIVAAVAELVDPDRVWRVVADNRDHFVEPVVLDGGFELPVLIREEWSIDDFRAHWIPAFPDALRKIRNALVHGREQRQSAAIAPTTENLRRLRPWALSLDVVAMQLMLSDV